MNVRHILGIFGGKDSAALFIGNPPVTSRRFQGGSISSLLLYGFNAPPLCALHIIVLYPQSMSIHE